MVIIMVLSQYPEIADTFSGQKSLEEQIKSRTINLLNSKGRRSRLEEKARRASCQSDATNEVWGRLCEAK